MDIKRELEYLEAEGHEVLATKKDHQGSIEIPSVDAGKYESWRMRLLTVLDSFPSNTVDRFKKSISEKSSNRYKNAEEIQSQIDGILQLVESGAIGLHDSNPDDGEAALRQIKLICRRFHKVAKALKNRHSDREAILIQDEYDVQYLFAALLRLYFDDVRTEEFTPSYAGRNSRTDFLLPNEGIVIEIKKTRANLKDDGIGEQLIVDLERYRSHPKCKFIVCFVYDPTEILANPRGIEADLNKTHENEALVIIAP